MIRPDAAFEVHRDAPDRPYATDYVSRDRESSIDTLSSKASLLRLPYTIMGLSLSSLLSDKHFVVTKIVQSDARVALTE